MEPTLEGLDKYEQEFQVRDETNVTFNAKWQWSPSQPNGNKAGVSGWALSDGKVIRLHVCANSPCTARYPASKYGNFPPPRHVQRTKPGTAAAAAESAATVTLPAPAAGSGAASSGATEVCPPLWLPSQQLQRHKHPRWWGHVPSHRRRHRLMSLSRPLPASTQWQPRCLGQMNKVPLASLRRSPK